MDNEIDDTAANRYDGGVMFRMKADKALVVVRVSDEALDDREQSRRPNSDRLAAFGRHRYAIESKARRKIVANKREKDGSILIRSIDLNG